ncbi:MAG TPA: hypothetical protein VN908_04895 [Gemmatimonadales bacterium]|nr:hypothetical protein [Gemmatimonadales bacterium]
MLDPVIRDALRYWETRRIAYNLALTLLAAAWVVLTWPHFQPAFRLDVVPKLVALAAIANLCYCAAYLIDVPVQHSGAAARWRRRRWILWTIGTLFALLLACYWIADEIYPFVDAS